MEHRLKRVRQELNDLGYYQNLVPESLDLVEKLTADLIKTTQSLKKYKKVAQETIEERNELQLGAEPYKCDNAKLVKECNDLHLTLLRVREQSDKIQRDFKRRLAAIEREKLECGTECKKLKYRIKDLELQLSKKIERACAIHDKPFQARVVKSTASKDSGISTRSKSKSGGSGLRINLEVDETCTMCDQKVVCLNKEIKRLKDEQNLLVESNESLKGQLENRDREIERLAQMLEGGRPFEALNQDCCYKGVDGKLTQLQNDICCLEKEKADLECQLKDCVAKQHEAMRRALTLAERNKKLEQELHEIDQMALAVEADCNSTVKMNTQKIQRMQEKMHDSTLQMQTMERDLGEMKREKQSLLADLEAFKVEKRHLQFVLENALDEKKRLNDQINQFTIIEHDLNLEIDRLVQASANQKRRIAELECKLLSEKFEAVNDQNKLPSVPSSPSPCSCPIIPEDDDNKPEKKLPPSKNKIKPKKASTNNIKDKKSLSKGANGKNNKAARGSITSSEAETLNVKKMPLHKKNDKMIKRKNSAQADDDSKLSLNRSTSMSQTRLHTNNKVAQESYNAYSPQQQFAPQNTPCSPCPHVAYNKTFDNDLAARQNNINCSCSCICPSCAQQMFGQSSIYDKRRSTGVETYQTCTQKVQTDKMPRKDYDWENNKESGVKICSRKPKHDPHSPRKMPCRLSHNRCRC